MHLPADILKHIKSNLDTHLDVMNFHIALEDFCLPPDAENVPGLCYLKMFPKKYQPEAISTLGVCPKIEWLYKYFQLNSSIPLFKVSFNKEELTYAGFNKFYHISRDQEYTVDRTIYSWILMSDWEYRVGIHLPGEIINLISRFCENQLNNNWNLAVGLDPLQGCKIGPWIDGLCYLRALPESRWMSAYKKYGFYISETNWINSMIEFSTDESLWKIDIAKGLSLNAHVCYNNAPNSVHVLDIVHRELRIGLPITRQVLNKIYNSKDWTIPKVRGRLIGSTGNFDLADLTLQQPTVSGYFCPPPQILISQSKRIQKPIVHHDETGIIVESEGIIAQYPIGSTDLGKIRHDYVASKLGKETDMPLSILGVKSEESVLTPDFIDIETKKVTELGTSRSEDFKSLLNDFESKKIKYNYLLEPLECNTYYLIVGVTTVVTNMQIPQSVVDDLCGRMRIGIQLEQQITEILGTNIFAGANTEDIRKAHALFASMTLDSCKSSKHYNVEEIMSMCNTPSLEDIQHAQKVVKKSMDESKPRLPQKREILNKYLSQFPRSECNNTLKRITNIPMILNMLNDRDSTPNIDAYNSDMPSFFKKIWMEAGQVNHERASLQEAIDHSLSNVEYENKHSWKKESTFIVKLSDSDALELAKTGVGAKFFKNEERILEKESLSKLSFHPDSDTSDIRDFINRDNLRIEDNDRMLPHMKNLILKSKAISTQNTEQFSIKAFKQLLRRKLICFYDQVTEIFTELSYNYKHWTVKNQFLHKVTRSGIHMIIRNTGSHIFVSFAFPKDSSKIMDTGRLGPKIYTSNNYYFTDFSSYNEPTLEHFVKAGPYMTSLLINLISTFHCEPLETDSHIIKTFNFISLLYLNNKTDSEEMLTSQRYLFMKLFEDATQDPYLFVDRLPEVLRSRLSAYILQRLISLMDYYADSRVLKIPEKQGEVVYYNYLNMRSIVDDSEIDLSQKINEFYYGYVVSKERGRGSDRNFKIIKKIIQEEYKFRDTVEDVFVKMPQKFVTYATDPHLLRVFLHLFKNIMKDKIGENYEDVILESFLSSLSFTNFTQLATLKASAKNHEKLISLPENNDDNRDKIMKKLKERNKEEMAKRPKVLEALMSLVKGYESEQKTVVTHMMQLIPWCLKGLEKKGYFDSDIFPKPQHGGDREIHVLEIAARIVQYTVELISRTICRFFPSETITHPETKERFVRDHYNKTADAYKESFVISKSADASKWCQRHHVSHFAAMLVAIVPKILQGFVIRTLKLWITKRLSFPLQLEATLLANKKTFSTNKTFVRFREEFFSGTGIFTQKMGNKIEITSGMMQGILHYTSSLYHTVIQEVVRIMVISAARKKFNMGVVCTVVQGSDDSGMMLGVEGRISPEKVKNCYTLLRFKEEITNYFSVYWNVCKSSIGTIDLIEYNSEWHSRHQIIKPTFRWVSACMEISVTERFIDRIRIFYQVLSQCLEGGASTLECAVIQLCQSWMHYCLLGIHTSILGEISADLIIKTTNIQCGFFPMDYDISCSIPGVDFLLYCMATYGKYELPNLDDDNMLQYEFEGQNKSVVPKDLRSVKLKFGKMYLWQSLVSRIDLGTLEDAINRIDDDPMILFGRHTSWHEEVPNLLIKVFSPGVKESINNISSSLRLMAASAYILTMPCLSIYENDQLRKVSLFSLQSEKANNNFIYNPMSKIRSHFPLHHEYKPFLEMIHNLSKSSETFSQVFHRSSKAKLIVFEVMKTEVDLIDLCKRQWDLGGKVSLSSRQFTSTWSQTQLKYPFLSDKPGISGLRETAKNLNLTIVELKNFLESLNSRSRSITLFDSAARYGGIESAMTRIYWPNVKIRSQYEMNNQEFSKLRSNIFSMLTFWYTDIITEQRVVDSIRNSKCLRVPYEGIPIRMRKLKTMFDWQNGSPKLDLAMRIVNQRQGVMGYFSVRQKGYGNNLSGYGCWRGQILGVPIILHFQGNTTIKIELKYLDNHVTTGKLIQNLLEEFKCCANSKRFESNIWMSITGKIVTQRHHLGEYIPIEINNSLRVDILQDIETNPWHLRVRGTSVRLVMRDNKTDNPTEYTIMSESFSNRDWIPDLTIRSEDNFLNLWNNSKSVNISDLEGELSKHIPDNYSRFLTKFKRFDEITTLGGWSLQKFRLRLITQMIDYKEAKAASKFEIEDELPAGPETMLDIQNIMDEISFGFENILASQTSVLNWADELQTATEDEEELDFSSFGNLFMTEETQMGLTQLAKDLEVAYDSPDRDSQVESSWMKMSQSNSFFNNLDKLAELQTGETFYDLYKRAKADERVKVKGFLGKILSMCLMRFVYEGIDTEESVVDFASESSRQVNTIMSETDLDRISREEIDITIQDLERVKNRVSGQAKIEIEKSIERYKRIRLLKMSPVRTSDLEDIDYGTFMTNTIKFLFENKITKHHNRRVEDNIKLTLIRMEMIEFREEQFKENLISNHELTLMREHINRNIVSSYLLDTLVEKYQLTIDMSLYQQTGNVDDIEIEL